MPPEIPNLNFATARFECTFGRGCSGICCRNGRPPIYPEEEPVIEAKLPAILPMLLPRARAAVQKRGWLSPRRKRGLPVARVVDGWCVFFNQGCVLHALGAAEGDKLRYKPAACALFPIDRDLHNRWYVRQRGFQGEIWDLFCLNPAENTPPAAETLRDEMTLARRITEVEAKEPAPKNAKANSTKIPKDNRPRSENSADTAK
jgi:hypothetical protein